MSGGKRLQDVQWESNITIVRLGLLRILSSNVAVTEESVPETLALNIVRLHNCQNAFQRILVIATGYELLTFERELLPTTFI